MKQIKCEQCKKRFKPKNTWQRFCSNKCRHNGWVLRRAKVLAVIALFLFTATGYAENKMPVLSEREIEIFKVGRQYGKADGMAEGYNEGYNKGYKKGYKDGELACLGYCEQTLRKECWKGDK